MADFCLCKSSGKRIAAFAVGEADGELIPRMARRGSRQDEIGRACEERLILRSIAGAEGYPFGEPGLLYAQQRRLQFIEPEIAANEFVMILGLHPVIAQHACPFGEGFIACGEKAGIAQCTEVFGGVKAGRASPVWWA